MPFPGNVEFLHKHYFNMNMNPPKRHGKKAVGKISSALRIFPKDIMVIINKESVDIVGIGPDGEIKYLQI